MHPEPKIFCVVDIHVREDSYVGMVSYLEAVSIKYLT